MSNLLAILLALTCVSCAGALPLPPALQASTQSTQPFVSPDIQRIALVGFEAVASAKEFEERVEAKVASRLLNTSRYQITERKRLDALLEEQALALSDFASPEAVEKIGQLLDAQAVLLGMITDAYQRAEAIDYSYQQGEGGLMPRSAVIGNAARARNFQVFRYSAGIAFSGRIVDVKSGKVLWSKEVARSFTAKQGEYDIRSERELMSRLLELAVDDFCADFKSR